MTVANTSFLLKFFLLITVIFPALTISAQDNGRSLQDQDTLNLIIQAYAKKSAWQTYTSHTTSDLQAALSIELSDSTAPYAALETSTYQFTGVYIPHLRATDGAYTFATTHAEWLGTEQITATSIHDEFAIIALDSQIYINGQHEFTDNLTDSSSPFALNTFTLFSEELANILSDSAIIRIADYNTFPTLENILTLFDNAILITDLGLQSMPNSEINAHAYQLQVDPTAGIVAYNLDIDRLLNNPNLPPTFSRDAFYDQLSTIATMTLTIYLDPENGELIAEQILLSADIKLDGTTVAVETSNFQLALTYNHTETYSNINAPADFELPPTSPQ